MKLFDKIDILESDYHQFVVQLDHLQEQLQPLWHTELSTIAKLQANFVRQTTDFLQADRKLNIGIIGQVKTGRSTFLNTLLFDGKNVLPKAVTPKTATVTKIQYGDTHAIGVEYYTSSEWRNIVANDKDLVAREILSMAASNALVVEEYLDRPMETIPVHDLTEMKDTLKDYVAENGRFTAVVKSVTLSIKKAGLRHLCVMDTPGLNDPVVARTDQTKAFLEQCDVVFFLSRSSQFLDKNDISLLTSFIPKKGVQKLILVCSRYDDGLNDTLMDYDDLETAHQETKQKLLHQSQTVFREIIDLYRKRGASKTTIHLLRGCSVPYFISTKAYLMSQKAIEDYSPGEKIIFENLNFFNTMTPKLLEEIGNFKEIQKVFKNVARQKEATLLKRGNAFIPDATSSLLLELENIKNTILKRIHLLSSNDPNALETQKRSMLQQTDAIYLNLNQIFDALKSVIDHKKEDTLLYLDQQQHTIQLHEKTMTETIVSTLVKSNAKWYNPLSWHQKAMVETQTIQEYTTLEVQDALEKIRTFAEEYKASAENTFVSSVEMPKLKQELLHAVMETHDISNEDFDPFFYKMIVNQTLSTMDYPHIQLDVTSILNVIADKFSGEVRSTSDKNSLKILLTACVQNFYDHANDTFEEKTVQLKMQLDALKEHFYVTLKDNIQKEYTLLLSVFQDKEAEIQRYFTVIQKINEMLGRTKL